jgi:hypothetical protein
MITVLFGIANEGGKTTEMMPTTTTTIYIYTYIYIHMSRTAMVQIEPSSKYEQERTNKDHIHTLCRLACYDFLQHDRSAIASGFIVKQSYRGFYEIRVRQKL